ncbi:MAG: hypothetical protein ACXWQE_12945 [Bdellovibrionales bacterium]
MNVGNWFAVLLVMASSTQSHADDLWAIIWSSDQTKTPAQKSLENWHVEASAVQELVSTAEGYPKIISTDRLPGLKPGLFVVLLGACEKAAVKNVVGAFQMLRKDVYIKKTSGLPDNACPKLTSGRVDEPVYASIWSGERLSATVVGFHAMVYVILKNRDGKVIDHQSYKKVSHDSLCGGYPEAQDGTISFAEECDSYDTRNPNTCDTGRTKAIVSAAEGRLVKTTKRDRVHIPCD